MVLIFFSWRKDLGVKLSTDKIKYESVLISNQTLTPDPKFLSTAQKGENMKKYLLIIGLLATLLVGCSSNKKTDKVQEIIDYIITNAEKIDKESGYDSDFTEDDFSFKIFYDKSKDNYLIQTYEAFEGEPNSIEMHYEWIDNSTKSVGYDTNFDKKLNAGDYEVIYKSGLYDK